MRSKITFRKFHLKEWWGMQAHLSTIHAAARTHSPDVPDKICCFLAAALDSSEEFWNALPWMEIEEALQKIQAVNIPDWLVPMLQQQAEEWKEKYPWLYVGGEWFHWLHEFSHWYDWKEEYIADLDIEKAFALMQEILLQKQLKEEWEYFLSEKSVEYDKQSKTAHLRPWPRPRWMQPAKVKPPKVKILKSMLPVGPISGDLKMMERLEIINDEKIAESKRDI